MYLEPIQRTCLVAANVILHRCGGANSDPPNLLAGRAPSRRAKEREKRKRRDGEGKVRKGMEGTGEKTPRNKLLVTALLLLLLWLRQLLLLATLCGCHSTVIV